MRYNDAGHMIHRIAIRWSRLMLLVLLLWAIAITLPVTMLLHTLWSVSFAWSALVAAIIYLLLLSVNRNWRIGAADVARYLDKTEPSLEESCMLLLEQPSGLLANLQTERIAAVLQTLDMPKPWAPKLKKVLAALCVSAVIVLLLSLPGPAGKSNMVDRASPGENPAGISSVTLRIAPPPYTGKAARKQNQFGMTVEENSVVDWTVQTNYQPAHLYFLFNDSIKLPLIPDAAHRNWQLKKQITRAGFYQLAGDSPASELYRIDMIPDEAPSIHIQQPKSNTVIDFGMRPLVDLRVTVTDDYGVQDTRVMATIASGSGEGVKFREEQLRFAASFAAHAQRYALERTIDLSALKMIPGDELYFYVLAKDNAGHEKRSDMSIITLADTAELMSLSGLQIGINVKPDFFRSQRQIIIETEQLLRDRDTLSAERFNERSNNLGIDQKLLRMRYGKFLGEENNLDGGSTADHDHEAGAEDFGNAAKILDEFSHKHDIAEDATFFSADTKAQLKATLAEMWNAELNLRVYKPREALPYEYKALRLLKELQQKDRVYVAKTSARTSPLRPEKRLTADLSKIQGPAWQKAISTPSEEIKQLRIAMAALEEMKQSGQVIFSPAMNIAYKYISNAAAQAPSTYLAALQSVKRLQQAAAKKQTVAQADLLQTQKALQRLMIAASPVPYHPGTSMQRVGQDYFQQLQHRRSNEQP